MATPDPSSTRDVADEEKLLSLIVSEIETNAPTICQTVEMGENLMREIQSEADYPPGYLVSIVCSPGYLVSIICSPGYLVSIVCSVLVMASMLEPHGIEWSLAQPLRSRFHNMFVPYADLLRAWLNFYATKSFSKVGRRAQTVWCRVPSSL